MTVQRCATRRSPLVRDLGELKMAQVKLVFEVEPDVSFPQSLGIHRIDILITVRLKNWRIPG